MREEKRRVKDFYDTFGWQKSGGHLYKDTEAFVDTRPVLAAYRHQVHLRVKDLLLPEGMYFLDAGSGAIPQPEYLEYSADYKWRVCIDFSDTALREARSRLRERGLYALADLAQLPFKDGIADAAVSAHVLYHIPHDEQELAVRELLRTLSQRGRCVIIYAQPSCILTRMALLCRPRFVLGLIPGVRQLWRKVVKPAFGLPEKSGADRPPLYFHAHPYRWFRGVIPADWNVDIRSWSCVDSIFTRTFIPDNALGRFLLRMIFWLDSAFPHAMVKLGAYPMVVISKR